MIYIIVENRQFSNHISYIFEQLFAESGHTPIFSGKDELAPRDAEVLISYGDEPPDNPDDVPNLHIREDRAFWDNYLKPESRIQHLPESIRFPAELGANPLFDEDFFPIFEPPPGKSAFEFPARNRIVLNTDLIASAFYLLTRYEEKVTPDSRDEHGKFKYSGSIIFENDLIQRPLVDEYFSVIWSCLTSITGLIPDKFKNQLLVTHDIDFIHQYFPAPNPIRSFLSLIFKHRRPYYAVKSNVLAHLHKVGLYKQPLAFSQVIKYAEQFGYRPYIFFITYGETRYERNYRISEPEIVELIKKLKGLNFLIGLHPSTVTWKNEEKMMNEVSEFTEATDFKPVHSRQHMLFIDTPQTYRYLEKAGVKQDFSMGYGEANGFRAGTGRPYPVFDFEKGRVLDIIEYPLIIMDNTMFTKQRLSPEKAASQIDSIYTRLKHYGGAFTILWHNTSFSELYGAEWDLIFENMVEQAIQDGFINR